jgi:hypothetical protein
MGAVLLLVTAAEGIADFGPDQWRQGGGNNGDDDDLRHTLLQAANTFAKAAPLSLIGSCGINKQLQLPLDGADGTEDFAVRWFAVCHHISAWLKQHRA